MNHKYNYVIFGSDWDLYTFSFTDIIGRGDVYYVAGNFPPKNSLLGFLYRIHHNNKINRVVNLPFRKLWNSYYFRNDKVFKERRPLCFLFFNNWISLESGLTSYLKKKYPGSKFVWVSFDIIRTHSFLFSSKKFNPLEIKKEFDMSLSFDKNDCKKYGLTYYPLVFSTPNKTVITPIENDIYFLGWAKDRFNEIISMYKFFKSKGLKCDFNIVGVPTEKQILPNEIHYISGMDYMTNLNHVMSSRCLLEIMQGGAANYTQRVCEAVCLNKKIISNNSILKEEPFYNERYMSIFSTVKDIDENFVDSIHDNEIIDYKYADKMSPVNLIRFLEERL